MTSPSPDPEPPGPGATAAVDVARTTLGARDPAERAQRAREFARAVPVVVVAVPAVFGLRFGVVDGFAWGLTTFLATLCALFAVGLWAVDKPHLHNALPLRNGAIGRVVDRVGGLWLVACAFGPLLSWAIGQVVPLGATSWRAVLATQLVLCVGLPVVTMLPNVRYARGGARWLAAGLLVGVTALPAMAARDVWGDLCEGPVASDDAPGQGVLPRSGRRVG